MATVLEDQFGFPGMRRVELCTHSARRHAVPRHHHPPSTTTITTARPPRLLIAPPSSVQHRAPASFHTGISLPVRSPRRVRLVTTTGWWRHSRSPGFHALSATGNIGVRQRPYRVECTGSLPNSEVKRRRARIVPGWGTAWEHLRVLSAFSTQDHPGQEQPRRRDAKPNAGSSNI